MVQYEIGLVMKLVLARFEAYPMLPGAVATDIVFGFGISIFEMLNLGKGDL